MKMKVVVVLVLVLVAALMITSVAQASTKTSLAIIKDAQDNGHLDGNWTVAQVKAALALWRSDPTLQQYTDVEGILQDFLASQGQPGAQTAGGLMFTGGETLVIFGAGLALIGSGLALRRRRA
jgi:hypothetical protein